MRPSQPWQDGLSQLLLLLPLSPLCPPGASASAAENNAAAAAPPPPLAPRDPVPADYVAAPYYPAPHGGWAADWAESAARAAALVSRMTLAEKVNITAGTGQYMGRCVANTGSAERVGFPQLCVQDGPLGVRTTTNVTAFPAGVAAGATFDKDLLRRRGAAIGREFRGKGCNVYLGPSVGALGRKPRGGRGWEGFGADPALQAIAGRETIAGVQGEGVIATIKHLVGNEQELYRMYNPFNTAYSANIDDRTMHELYLWPFAEGIRAGVGSVMTSYNDLNGSATSQNSHLLNGLVKDELGFQGFVMTDWLSQLSGVGSALAGLDMSMPGDTVANAIPLTGYSHWMAELTRSALNGSVPLDRLNDMATRVVSAWYQLGQDDPAYAPRGPNFHAWVSEAEGPFYPGAVVSPRGLVNEFVDVQADHARVAKQVAQDAVTLLKNEGGALPLDPARVARLSVFGSGARADPEGINSCVDQSCNRGTLGMGWGSGSATYPYLDDPISALRRKFTAAGPGNNVNVTLYDSDVFPGDDELGDHEPAEGDVALVFISADAGENTYTVEGNHGDRDADGLRAWHGGDDLVRAAAARFGTVVVVAHTVGPIVVEPWIDLPAVKALVFAHLPGQEAGDSLVEVLLGEVSPSGHLPYSIPASEDDYPPSVGLVSQPLGQTQDTFSEGLYIDYRHLHRSGVRARFPFGHGLSYASFSLTSASVSRGPADMSSPLPPPPPSRPASPVAGMDNDSLPPASEAVAPPGFQPVQRYLYSWLPAGEAEAARAVGAANETRYPYPDGYSPEQRPDGPAAGGAPGGNPALWEVALRVTARVRNTSPEHGGRAVVQAYVQFPVEDNGDNGGFDTPVVQLRDFAKTAVLSPSGEGEEVVLELTRRDLSVWDPARQNWVVPSAPGGRYRVWLGWSADDLHTVCYSDTLVCESGVDSPV